MTLIKREDAIDALCHNCAYYTDAQCKTDSGYWCESGAMIREDIPSAELTLQTPKTYGKSINPSNAEVVEDYISRADAIDAACNEMDWLDDGCVEERKTMIKDVLSELPSADAVEVVRCKDCKHKYVSGNGTTQYYVCDFMDAQYEEDGFCHHAESEVEE